MLVPAIGNGIVMLIGVVLGAVSAIITKDYIEKKHARSVVNILHADILLLQSEVKEIPVRSGNLKAAIENTSEETGRERIFLPIDCLLYVTAETLTCIYHEHVRDLKVLLKWNILSKETVSKIIKYYNTLAVIAYKNEFFIRELPQTLKAYTPNYMQEIYTTTVKGFLNSACKDSENIKNIGDEILKNLEKALE